MSTSSPRNVHHTLLHVLQMPTNCHVTVLIVGAGPTGLLLAAELCRRGVRARIIDANPGPLHWDRATVVHPRSLEIFESLGIVEPLLAIGVKQRMARLHSAGRVLGEIDLALCGSRYGFNIGVSEEVTESILTDYLHSLGGEIVRSSRLIALEPTDEAVVATIDHAGNTETVSADWLVGCDGVRSVTRTLSGIELTGSDHSETWAVFDATVSDWPHSYEANFAYLDEIPVILTALPNRRWRVYLRPSTDDSDLIADATSTLDRYFPTLAFDNVSHPTRFHCHSKVARQYRQGRVLIAGDAAHVCSPSQGHGMNSGLQDAFNLAWKLALVCQGHAAPALLESYEAERRPVAERITASGDAFEQAQEITDPAERSARDEQLVATFADPSTKHHESIAEAELDIDYCHSPIVLGDQHDALAPGHRLPDTLEIHHPNGERQLLHELAHRPGHTALVIGGPNTDADTLRQLADSIRALGASHLFDEVFAVATAEPPAHLLPCSPDLPTALGIADLTLLVVRPDGHVGLRADRDHVAMVVAYRKRLTRARHESSPRHR
jgi:2-polyprenyl-6-methoxyphenol hydroxylase-like FAD-dependent oxidoreductase